MIQVPDEIKELLHRDSCPKNIRIHFPNGERSDICNDQIVMDSVSFTESLCSQNDLKFGLCESPVFECEVVGVGNVTGATIEVYCEIICPASVQGAIWQADLMKYVYQIPYGLFVIQEAKRQADMIHRKLTAFNVLASYDFRMTPYQKHRADYEISSNMLFTQGICNLISENTQSNTFGLEEIELEADDFREVDYDGVNTVNYYHSAFAYTEYVCKAYRINASNSSSLYIVKVDDDEFSPDNIFIGYYSLHSHQYSLWTAAMNVAGLRLNEIEENKFESWRGKVFYPYMSMGSSDNDALYKPSSQYNEGVYIVVRYKKNRYSAWDSANDPYGPGHDRTDVTILTDPSNIHIYRLDSEDTTTFEFERVKNLANKYVVKDSNKLDLRALFEGYVETKGLFCGIDRYGKFFTLNIKQKFLLLPENDLYPDPDLHPESSIGGQILPNDYQSCWYDDDYTKPYGRISVSYKNTNDEECGVDYYLPGFSSTSDEDSYKTYYLDGNYIIQNSRWTESQILAICAKVSESINGVSYMPVEFVGRGLPYVEVGDTFEILTASNDSIITIVLNRTLSGEQVLTDSYKSV